MTCADCGATHCPGALVVSQCIGPTSHRIDAMTPEQRARFYRLLQARIDFITESLSRPRFLIPLPEGYRVPRDARDMAFTDEEGAT